MYIYLPALIFSGNLPALLHHSEDFLRFSWGCFPLSGAWSVQCDADHIVWGGHLARLSVSIPYR